MTTNIRLIAIFLLLVSAARAQQVVGEVEYRYKIFYDKIYTSQSFISPQERDRTLLSWNNTEGYSTRMILQFSPQKSIYSYGEDYEVRTYSWRKEDYFIVNNFEDQSTLRIIESMGKTHIIKDNLTPPKWKILNELREIQGHMCMKAMTEDTLKNQKIVAWFAADIPVPAGPELLEGLPGLILGVEVNDDQLIIEAEKITFGEPAEPIKLPKKLKGKEMTQAEYDAEVYDFIQTAIKGEKSWVWEIRY